MRMNFKVAAILVAWAAAKKRADKQAERVLNLVTDTDANKAEFRSVPADGDLIQDETTSASLKGQSKGSATNISPPFIILSSTIAMR